MWQGTHLNYVFKNTVCTRVASAQCVSWSKLDLMATTRNCGRLAAAVVVRLLVRVLHQVRRRAIRRQHQRRNNEEDELMRPGGHLL